MSETIQTYINNLKENEKKLYEEQKEQTLIKLGLYKKEYAPDNTNPYGYPEAVWKDGHYVYYKKVPLEVTDDEYKEILKYSKRQLSKIDNASKEKSREEYSNGVATAILIIAFLEYFIGFMSIFFGGVSAFASAFISGTFTLGFAEVIKLLYSINEKIDSKK